jgi:glucose/arabinose dehydrogenase
MPDFEHQPAEAEALLAHLVGHDRIPAGAPQWPGSPSPDTQAAGRDAELRKAGAVLAGTRGFSCTACHKIASHEPRGVALATRGSDLYLLGERMRPEFFSRWTRSPLRVIPGMEMPSFERPIAGILDGQIDRQLAALWEALNDKSGPPKIDTSTIEQILTVAPDGNAKIIRDVFALGDPLALKFVPRAFAVGFGNGVNVLFDLDAMALRDWWRGDFARQRSSGKSWFWEPAGRGIIAAGWDTPDIALRKAGDPKGPVLMAQCEGGHFGRLHAYGRIMPPDEDSAVAPDEPRVRIRAVSHLDLGVKVDYSLTFLVGNEAVALDITESFLPTWLVVDNDDYWWREVTVRNVPAGYDVILRDAARGVVEAAKFKEGPVPWMKMKLDREKQTATCRLGYPDNYAMPKRELQAPASLPPLIAEPVASVPGFDGIRLPLPRSIMPTAITWTADGTLAFCSLKGEVFLAKDTDGYGVEDKLTTFEEGLAAPYGLIADGKDLIVAHKPELLRLRDTDGDGRADVREVIANGWGYTEDYHDWTTGIVRDSKGNLYVGTGSDYARPGRDPEKAKWRGKVLRIDRNGAVTPLGHGFRYPTGLAITPDDQIFVSDNQGVQNTFNEINHLVEGASYGVPSLFEEHPDAPTTLPAIQVPHPWTRSVNGIFFLPSNGDPSPLAGHGIGCEYDLRFLVRFTLERVGKAYQGAVYPLSLPTPANARDGFLGTLCGAVSPKGDIYIGSVYDSGWLGGTNVGDVVRLRPNGKLPVGIREIRAAEGRFLISFTGAIDKAAAGRTEHYNISGYTRKWQGTYATPDSGRHQLEIQAVDVADDELSVVVHTSRQQEGHVYEISLGKIGPAGQTTLWPATGSYTLNQMPVAR